MLGVENVGGAEELLFGAVGVGDEVGEADPALEVHSRVPVEGEIAQDVDGGRWAVKFVGFDPQAAWFDSGFDFDAGEVGCAEVVVSGSFEAGQFLEGDFAESADDMRSQVFWLAFGAPVLAVVDLDSVLGESSSDDEIGGGELDSH